MNVSQLCSSNTLSENNVGPSTVLDNSKRTPNSLEFILAPLEKTIPLKPQTIEHYVSNGLVFEQCSLICEKIWQLKLQHKYISIEERELQIDTLSQSAHELFKTLQSAIDRDKEKSKKRELVTTTEEGEKEEDFEEEDDEENEEEDDEDEEEETGSTAHTNQPIKDHAEYELIRQARNLQDTQSRPKYRRRNRKSIIGQKCHSCSTTETPEWRRGPDGARTLCNACGLHYSKLLRKGSIFVQTQNYLVTSGIPPTSPSIVSATAISHNHTSKSSIATPSSSVNFPFVLMDPKKPSLSSQKLHNYTHHHVPNQVSNSVATAAGQNNTITPLRIYQWRQQ